MPGPDGVPQWEDPFLQQYLQGREALIEQERSKRSDDAFRQSLSPMAVEACDIVSAIVAEEQETFWPEQPRQKDANGQDVPLFPGASFELTKNLMRDSKSWRIVRKMPKGALLHHHMDGGMDVEFVIRTALQTPGMSMASDSSLSSPGYRTHSSLKFAFRKQPLAGQSIWQDTYKPGNWVSMKDAAQAFPGTGEQGFLDWLKSRILLPSPPSDHRLGINDIWVKFQTRFPPFQMLQSYEPVYRAGFRRLLAQFAEDNIHWADLRLLFLADFCLEGHEEQEPDNASLLRVMDEEIKAFQKTDKGQRFWGCRFIWSSLRRWDTKQVIEHMRACVEMKLAFPHLICGYDLVGQEDAGRTLADLTPELFFFKKHCMENGVDIPFFFHAGECLGDGSDTDTNLFDSILLGTRRIGHGYSLFKHPLLMDMVKAKGILIESCPISNELLRLNGTVNAHPLPALLARGVACSLSNDDPGIMAYPDAGVSPDFWQALQCWGNVDLAGLGSLAENSVRWASFEPDLPFKEWRKDVADGLQGQGVRAERMREWRTAWDRFCEWIVQEYAVEYGGNAEG